MIVNEIDKYVKQKKAFRLWGWIGAGVAVLHILDPNIPFPIPFRGWLGIYVAILLLIPCLILLIISYRPPNARMIEEVARRTNGYITATFLIHFLHISGDMAEKLVLNLFKKGYLDVVNKVTNDTPLTHWVCVFIGVTKTQVTTTNQNVKRDSTLDLSAYTSNNPEMSVEQINNMLLQSSMRVGHSGQPR